MDKVTSKAGSNGYSVNVEYIPLQKPEVGLYVYDDQNRYIITEELSDFNEHTGKTSYYKVKCFSGPNQGNERWIMRETFLAGGHVKVVGA